MDAWHIGRHGEGVAGGNRGELGESARRSHAEVAHLGAVRYQADLAVSARAARNDRQDSNIGARGPAARLRPDRHDLTTQFVSHHHAGASEWLSLDVRPTYATRRDPDDQFVG